MKKLLSILTALLILVSGMHFTMSMHFCDDSLAAVTLSAGGGDASCGMPSAALPADGSEVISVNCCHNSNLEYSVDDYSPSVQLNFQDVTPLQSFLFILPVTEPVEKANKISIYRNLIFPEKDLMAGSVPIEGLCEYRI